MASNRGSGREASTVIAGVGARRPRAGRGVANVSVARLVLALAFVFVFVPLAFVASGVARAQQGDVRVQLGASSITIEETVRLAIVATGLDGELDTSALEREFDVIGRSSSRDVQILNGERTSTVTWVLELVPRSVGVFTVPPVTVGGVESELLTLTVTDAPTGAKRDVYVEASVDEGEPWVQSQVILTLKVFRAIDIVDGALGEPSGEGLDVRALGGDRRYEEERDGRRYVVDERRFALFPQRSGALEIEPITLSVTVPADPTRVRGFFSPTTKLVRRTDPIRLAVRERPADTSGWWLPATGVVLEEAWRGGPDGDPTRAGGEARVGEPLTRTLVLRAGGVLDTQLPDVPAPDVDGLAIYADDPVRESVASDDGLDATQTLSFALIPERAGTFELPAVTLDWFDVAAGRTRTASLPARSLTVRPGPGDSSDRGEAGDPNGSPSGAGAAAALAPADGAAAGATAPGTDAAPGDTEETLVPPVADAPGGGSDGVPSLWRTLAIAALVGWALTAVVLWRARHARRSVPDRTPIEPPDADRVDPREARRRVESAARDGDAGALARAVLARAAAHWPDEPPRSLAALARRLPDDDGVVGELRAFDTVLYGRDGAARAAPLPALDTFPARLEKALSRAGATSPDPSRGRRGAPSDLPPL